MLQSARNLSALVALFVFCPQAPADDTRPNEYISRARQFLRTLYPGLGYTLIPIIHDHNRLGDSDTTSSFLMDLCEPEKGLGDEAGFRRGGDLPQPSPVERKTASAGCRCSPPVLGADFGFEWRTENKALFMAWVWGPVVRGRQERFAEEVDKHPEWSETRVLAALNGDGAKFGPDHKAEFLRALPIEKLKLFAGKLEVISAEFQVFESNADGALSKAYLTWIVRANWHSPDGRQEADCVLAFEPFEGKLLWLTRGISPHEAKGGQNR